MSVLSNFYPDQQISSTYDVDFSKLYQEGYRGIIFDIDNTLVPHGEEADERSIALFKELKKKGFQTMLLSNNKETRVKSFNKEIQTGYIYKAGKPGKNNYYRAMERMGTKTQNTLFIGDQLFTDIWGAKRVGIYSILVEPIHPKEEIQIVLKRYLERIVLFFYHRQTKNKEKKIR